MGRAFFSREIASSLYGKGVKFADIMANVRRYERMGLVYVRGYRADDHHSSFQEGYLITWIDQEKSRDEALADAVDITNTALSQRETANPVIEGFTECATWSLRRPSSETSSASPTSTTCSSVLRGETCF